MTEAKHEANIVGVRFSPIDRVKYFDSGDNNLAVADRVVVETEKGPQEGLVVIAPQQILSSELRVPLAQVLYKMNAVERR